MRHSISEREDFSLSLWISLSFSKLKCRPRYLKDSPDLTVGTSSVLINSFGSCWRDREENLLIPNVTHLSTLIIIFDH